MLVVFDDARSLPYEKAFTYAEAADQFNVDALVEGNKKPPAATGGAAPAQQQPAQQQPAPPPASK